MQHDLGYFEEGQLDKPYDLKLLKPELTLLVKPKQRNHSHYKKKHEHNSCPFKLLFKW